MKYRHYNFVSIWTVAAPIGKTELVILNIDTWKDWWPGLEQGKVVSHNNSVVGGVIDCTFKSLAGYRLTMQLTITHYERKKLLEFTSLGDLQGKGSWAFEPIGETETKMRINWDVATTKTWMNIFGPLLRPLFVLNHRILMRQGEAGLQKYLS